MRNFFLYFTFFWPLRCRIFLFYFLKIRKNSGEQVRREHNNDNDDDDDDDDDDNNK